MDTTVPTYFKRTSMAVTTGVTLAMHLEYIGASSGPDKFLNTHIGAGALVDVINNGNSSGGAGHLLGVIGRVQDTSSGGLAMFGLEGKTIRRGSVDSDAAVWGISDYDGAVYGASRQRNVFQGFGEIYNGDPSVPVATGGICIFKGINGVGGDPSKRYVLQGDLGMMITTAGKISSFDSSTGLKSVSFEHSGSEGKIACDFGPLRLYCGSDYLVLQQGPGFVPLVEGAALGIEGFRWQGNFTYITLSGTRVIFSGAGSPEGVITALTGSLFMRTDGSTSTSLYVKTSGTGNTGWTAK